MPRTSRVVAVDYPHHVTQRGNNRECVFFDEQDHQTYLAFLTTYTQKFLVNIWAYCLMPNHIHLLTVPRAEESLARGIGLTNQSYTRYFNRKYFRSGRVWQNRFYSCVVDTDLHLWSVARYIENNPVAAGLTKSALDYRWSSANHHLRRTTDPLLIKGAWLDDRDLDDYRNFMLRSDNQITNAIQQATRSGRPFCSSACLARLEQQLGRPLC